MSASQDVDATVLSCAKLMVPERICSLQCSQLRQKLLALTQFFEAAAVLQFFGRALGCQEPAV